MTTSKGPLVNEGDLPLLQRMSSNVPVLVEVPSSENYDCGAVGSPIVLMPAKEKPPTNVALHFALLAETVHEQRLQRLSIFFQRPQLPTQETCMLRVLVNLFFFARNYVNLLFAIVLLLCVWEPSFIAIFVIALAVHLVQRESNKNTDVCADHGMSGSPSCTTECKSPLPTQRPRKHTWLIYLLKLCQFLSCVTLIYCVGVLRVTLILVGIMIPIIGHAYLTPYTDEAYQRYRAAVSRRGIHVEEPRSPTRDFQHVDPTFEEALARPLPSIGTPLQGTISTPISIHGSHYFFDPYSSSSTGSSASRPVLSPHEPHRDASRRSLRVRKNSAPVQKRAQVDRPHLRPMRNRLHFRGPQASLDDMYMATLLVDSTLGT